jgi:putative endonuclease
VIVRRWWQRLIDRVSGREAGGAADGRPAHLRTGQWGEEVAERFLVEKGWKILGRRVRPGRHGGRDELDLIARAPEEVLVFVEVKTRRSETFGRPLAAITRRKRIALSRAAWKYLKRLKTKPDYFRFDVVEVIGEPDGPVPVVRHIEAAFPMEGGRRIPW